MGTLCEKCKTEEKLMTKNRDVKTTSGEKIRVTDVPFQSCECYGETITMLDAAIVEYYAKSEEEHQHIISFKVLKEMYKDKNMMDLIDPEGKLKGLSH
ncbi:hypothetical protein J2S74_002856 [Evansella vedderi]|uniref:YgiT-type zinc finger domain-containing protein n=1 Tax=Evansella vedderi TaxID=38282 RepID=A0ABT9ZX77_9BACI|nr:hypothetical protein [Evansella vedderi]MDQ0255474.1 hypothetical protein [Evansella vedderi]